MRRMPVIAALSALVLTLSGCLGGGPSNADVSKVRGALEALSSEWTVEYVENSTSYSQGVDRSLGIGLHHDLGVESVDLVDLFTVIVAALPASYRFEIHILVTVGPEEIFPDLRLQARTVGLDMGREGAYKHGEIIGKVKDLSRIVEEYKP